MPAYTIDHSISQVFHPKHGTGLFEGWSTSGEEFFEGFYSGFYWSFFFVSASGPGSFLFSVIFCLSSIIHSTTSPFSNSIACATAAGKLIYHCSLLVRLMSWIFVGNPI